MLKKVSQNAKLDFVRADSESARIAVRVAWKFDSLLACILDKSAPGDRIAQDTQKADEPLTI